MKLLLCSVVPGLIVVLLLSATHQPASESTSCDGCQAVNTFVPPQECFQGIILDGAAWWTVVRDIEVHGGCAEVFGDCLQVDRCLSLITVHGSHGAGPPTFVHTASVNTCGDLEIVPISEAECSVDGWIHADCGSCGSSSH